MTILLISALLILFGLFVGLIKGDWRDGFAGFYYSKPPVGKKFQVFVFGFCLMAGLIIAAAAGIFSNN